MVVHHYSYFNHTVQLRIFHIACGFFDFFANPRTKIKTIKKKKATEVGCICNSNGNFEQLDSGEVSCINCSEVVISQNQAKELNKQYKKSYEA